MASILDRYGIKEVADVTFYEINANGNPAKPVLFLDTLKVSTIEQTAETTEARGGKGNAKLISWDYNKEINVTLEDALFSPKSMQIMFGNSGATAEEASTKTLLKTIVVVPTTNSLTKVEWKDAKGTTREVSNFELFDETGSKVTGSTVVAGKKYFASFCYETQGSVIEISADKFPGTYYITGDTYARSEATGADDYFQFIIPKAKVTAENTITLEAEGDPSVFNLNLTVLRPADGAMMKLVQYTLEDGTSGGGDNNELYKYEEMTASTGTEVGNSTIKKGADSDVTITGVYDENGVSKTGTEGVYSVPKGLYIVEYTVTVDDQTDAKQKIVKAADGNEIIISE